MNPCSTFGNRLRLTVRGASHASCLRFTLSGFPRGFAIDEAALAAFMERRAPGRDRLSTARRETDAIAFLSGVTDGVTDGAEIRGVIRNADMRPKDYGAERTVPRPGHADFPQWVEAGRIPTGGGANSGRLTAPLCAVGGLCLQYLARRGVSVSAEIVSVAGKPSGFEASIERAQRAGDSVGGVVRCTVAGLPAGLGGALFGGLESSLSAALFAIPGAKGVEFGDGFACAAQRGSAFNDAFETAHGAVRAVTNRQGGILGGRTSGMPVVFQVALRPTPTIFKPQPSVDLATMTPAVCEMRGRHDPCIVRRAVPVVEALAAFVVADLLLSDEAAHPRICLVLAGRTLAEDLSQYEAQRYFTDMVELRADLLLPRERARAAAFPALLPASVPVLLTFRRRCDGGAFDGAEKTRAAFFRKVLSARTARGFDYVDFEDDFRDARLTDLARCSGARIVRSRHDFTGPVKNLRAELRRMVAGTDEIAKVAFMPHTLADVSALLSPSMASLPPHVVCAMGSLGLASRALAGRSHSLWTYASADAVESLGSLGHVSPQELVRTYRLRTVTNAADLYGVTGWPLKATRSPEINNAAFADEDQDAVMVPFPARTAREALSFMKATGMRGMAVTIPHKREIMPLLDRIDRFASRVGAVNTVVREGDRYVGYNTDVAGFAEALTAFVGSVKGRRVALLGDGGAAQAVKVALRALGARVAVFHRQTPPQGYDVLVNATPVDPIPDYAFTGRESVYDLRYVPEETPLMARARAAGCRVENGFSMLCAQAREQRRLYLRARGML